MSNLLKDSKSPYLLQHADNPVHWMPWSQEALRNAQQEHKLVIISIGYSSCHWCHVMAHESFENQEVADLMNDKFISIKVDREERPDIDQIYMNAAMLVNGHGGWPLNAIALPDGRPIFAGTYYPKDNWLHLLKYYSDIYEREPHKLIQQATDIQKGIVSMDDIPLVEKFKDLDKHLLNDVWNNWSQNIDLKNGGRRGTPKFVMPNNYVFLLKYALSSKNKMIQDFIEVTLDKIALGGINDAVTGGFFRYSTDSTWHIPHFEKMLYDNAQLLTVYAQAYRFFKKELYLDVIESTYKWLQAEMKAPDGGYFSALDADSEGKEGEYYIFTWDELQTTLNEDFKHFTDYYQCSKSGNWESGLNHLHSNITLQDYCKDKNLDFEQTHKKFFVCKEKLQALRASKVRPGLDDKRITGWNALLLSGLANAYWATRNDKYLQTAKDLVHFIETKLKKGDGLWHTYNKGEAYGEAFLSDYAPLIQAYIDIYQVTFDETYLSQSYKWMDYVLKHFYDEKSGLFYLNSDFSEDLVSRPKEIQDNVISSSNSMMARALWQLSTYMDDTDLKEKSWYMLQNILDDVIEYGTFYAEWASLLWEQTYPYFETVLTNNVQEQSLQILHENYLPQVLWMATQKNQSTWIPLLSEKKPPYIYVCRHQTCQAPMSKTQEVLDWVSDLEN
ncbi:MAG: thioredoxin domain-containing protein [Chitinophagales bacterium]|nr:thioredoxin domain-containing protein [Chitinophagales bacterium]